MNKVEQGSTQLTIFNKVKKLNNVEKSREKLSNVEQSWIILNNVEQS